MFEVYFCDFNSSLESAHFISYLQTLRSKEELFITYQADPASWLYIKLRWIAWALPLTWMAKLPSPMCTLVACSVSTELTMPAINKFSLAYQDKVCFFVSCLSQEMQTLSVLCNNFVGRSNKKIISFILHISFLLPV